MAKSDTAAPIKSGLKAAASALLGLAWLGLVIAGLGQAFYPAGRPRIGWMLLGAAAVILFSTAHLWVRILPGVLSLAAVNAVISMFQGHAVNLPSVQIPRAEAALAALLLVLSAVLSVSFTRRRLNIPDRLAFLIYASCIFWGAIDHRVSLPMQMGVATFCLLAAWTYDRFRPHQESSALSSNERPV